MIMLNGSISCTGGGGNDDDDDDDDDDDEEVYSIFWTVKSYLDATKISYNYCIQPDNLLV